MDSLKSLTKTFEFIQTQLDKYKNEIFLSFLKNGCNLAKIENQEGIQDIMSVLEWYNSSVNKYTSLVETKLLQLVKRSFEQQAKLETKLQEYMAKYQKLEETNENTRLKEKNIHDEYQPNKNNPKISQHSIAILTSKKRKHSNQNLTCEESDEEDEGPDGKQKKQNGLDSDSQSSENSNDEKNDYDDDKAAKLNEIKRKLNITIEFDEPELNESFLDDELIRELLSIYLRENGVSRYDFINLIFRIHPNNFFSHDAISTWNCRTRYMKQSYHKIKKIMSIKAYSPSMKAVEIDIYKKRMRDLIRILNSKKQSQEDFARKYLELSLTDFETLMNNCMQDIPLNNRDKDHMNIITEFISEEHIEQIKRYDTFKRKIKDKKGIQRLIKDLKAKLCQTCISQRKFSQYVLNCPFKNFKDIIYFTDNSNYLNLLLINAIYKWLKDESRFEKLKQAMIAGDFYYMDEKNIEEDVLKLFYV